MDAADLQAVPGILLLPAHSSPGCRPLHRILCLNADAHPPRLLSQHLYAQPHKVRHWQSDHDKGVVCQLLYNNSAATIMECYRTYILIVALLPCLLRRQHHLCYIWLRNEQLCFLVHCLAAVLHAA